MITPQAAQNSITNPCRNPGPHRQNRTISACFSSLAGPARGSAHPRRELQWQAKTAEDGHGEETENPGPARQKPALAALVRQSGQSGHDGALSRALSQLRPHRPGASLRQADRRHRADRLGPVAVQPPSSGTGQARARRHPRCRRHRLRVSLPSDPGDRQAPDRGARPKPRVSRASSRCCTAIRSTAWC